MQILFSIRVYLKVIILLENWQGLVLRLNWRMRYLVRFRHIYWSTLRQELSYKKYDLTKRINDQLGRNALDNVIFV